MDFRQIHYFVALYEERSITKAAKRLHVVQPAVSMQIRKLELEYGLTLFERTPQGVYPNAVAERLYPLCQKVLGNLGVARTYLKEAKGRVAGRLSIGVPPSLAHSCLADVIVDFCAQYPDVRPAIYEGYTGHLVDWLTDGLLECAILHGSEADRRLQLNPLLTEELMVVMARETAGDRSEMKGAELASFSLALPSEHNLTRLLMDSAFTNAGLSLEPAVELDSLAAVLNLIRRPGWATLLPGSAVAVRQLGDFAKLRLIEPSISRTLMVATQPGTELSLAAKLFLGQLDLALKLNAAGTGAHQVA